MFNVRMHVTSRTFLCVSHLKYHPTLVTVLRIYDTKCVQHSRPISMNMCANSPLVHMLNMCANSPLVHMLNMCANSPLVHMSNMCVNSPLNRIYLRNSDNNEKIGTHGAQVGLPSWP